ncbi:Ig-like domain-containing protein [Cognaticolwellia mytili]|uniref:Ig-like domain-containing protein n=1 Tax=Cognaticolwellia mytili TaxID=1888913 RepID=UPI001301EB3E|nr:Ig-like domain-containing protein [Cognaticolwellia mytili]
MTETSRSLHGLDISRPAPGRLGQAIKAAIPMLAMLGGGAVASTRNATSTANGQRLKSNTAVYVSSHTDKMQPGQMASAKQKRSAFGAFTNSAKGKKSAEQQVKVNDAALAFLKANDLLQQGDAVKARLSGNTLGRKVFADFCLQDDLRPANVAPNNALAATITAQANVMKTLLNKTACNASAHIWHTTTAGVCSRGGSTIVQCMNNSFYWVGINVNGTDAGGDSTAPVFENSTPSIASITDTGATVSVDLDEDGTVYYVVVADGASVPSAAEVKAGTGSGGSGQLASGNFTTSGTTGNEAFSGLSGGTAYDIYVVAEDGVPNLQATATRVDFTTTDTTAPTFDSGPSIGTITGTGATVSVDLNEDGTVYYVVVADGAAAPSAAEVKAGTGSGGSGELVTGNFATSSTTGNEAFNSLSGSTPYDIYVVAEDGIPNLQASATKVDFTTLDSTAPTISAITIPDSDHKVGDTVTATITVTSDTDDYTTGSGGISGTINGYALGSLSKSSDTTYTATFTITDGGTDVVAGSDIAVNFTLDDSSGNTSGAFTTAISQVSDAIYANLPDIDLTVDSNTIAEDGGVATLTATLSGSLNNQWPSGITVNLAYSGTGSAGTDYTKSDSIVISAGNSSNTATITGTADTRFDAATDETAIVDISSVSEGNENGVQQQTITITDAEIAPTVTLSVGNASVNENAGTSTITATLSHQTYDSTVVNVSYSGTAVGAGTDYNTPSSSITINAGSLSANAGTGITAVNDGSSDGNLTVIIDVDSVTGSASENGSQQQTVTIIDDEDGLAPTISAVSITDSDHKVGDTVTATITVTSDADDYTTGSGGITGTIDGYTLGALSKSNDTTYTATFTITDGGTDVAAGSDITVSFTMDDSSGNTSAAYTTAISQGSDAIYANLPDVDLTADSNTIAEDGGVSTLTATLSNSLNNQWPVDITVNLAYTGTGTAGTDYSKSDSLVISAGNSTNTTTVTGTADTLFDAAANETAIIDIDSLSAGNEGTTNQQTITITDAESAPTVILTTGSGVVVENGGTSALTATLSNATYADVTVNLGYTGTASSGGVDYNTPSSSITISGGSTTANAATGITSVDDGDTEGFETIITDITSVSGGSATESGSQQKTVTINDNETIPVVTLSASSNSLLENAGSSTLTATLDQVTFEDVTVNLTYSGTATSGTDYGVPAGSITITAGQLTGTTTITATDDSSDEDDETIIVDIASVSGGNSIENVTPQTETLTITDNDTAPTPTPDPEPVPVLETASVTLSVSSNTISENGGSSTVTASLDKVISKPVTVSLAYSGTASGGNDYTSPVGSVSIAAGETSASLSLIAIADKIIEENETIIIDISAISDDIATESGNQQRTVTITEASAVLTTVSDVGQLDEDNTIAIDVLANDSSQGSSLNVASVSVITVPEHGVSSVNSATGVISYTPEENFNGNDSFTYTVSDLVGNRSEATSVSISIAAVNDTPMAQDDSFNHEGDEAIELDVVANDIDIDGDALKIIGATVDSGLVSFSEERITYTPIAGTSGTVVIDYHISDGLDGEDSAQAFIKLGAIGNDLPLITVPAGITVNAEALATKVDLGIATALDKDGNALPVSIDGDTVFFPPGLNTVFWRATDSEGRTSALSQVVKVKPLISLDKDQTVLEGYSVNIGIHLNGLSPEYPLSIPYTVAGSAEQGLDYELAAGEVVIESGTEGLLSFNILADSLNEQEETVIVELGDGVNRGSKFSHTITITEQSIPPTVSLQVKQNGEERFIANLTDGDVTVTSTVTHPDTSKQYGYLWSNNEQLLTDVDSNDERFTFEPENLALGIYHLQLTVTDLDSSELMAVDQVTIQLVSTTPVLGNEDSDNDGIPDDVEGLGDDDSDGIPDYLDTIDECNVVPEMVGTTDSFLLEGDPGVCLRLGDVALGDTSGGIQITDDDNSDNEVINVGGIFDFIAYGLPQAGQQYRVVLPQIQPIPAEAVYRKQSLSGSWSNFVEDADNQLWSTEGESGFCPPPGHESWQAGLNEGFWCVQLVMTDGGANDADGVANNAIVDPGGVSVLLTSNTKPVAVADTVSVKRNQSIVIDVLANDTDADQDSLSIGVATAAFGMVTITADNQLNYQSADDFIGEDTIIYSLSDGNGGTDSSTVTVTVYTNNAPTAVDDIASTDDRTDIVINVLANDSDADGDSLTVTSATVDNGQVSINGDSTLTYKPDNGFGGSALITYTIADGHGEQASAQVTVSVKAVEVVIVKNNAKGGSMGVILIILAGVALYRSRRQHKLGMKYFVKGAAVITAATSMNLAAAEPQWFLTGSVGQSHVSTQLKSPNDIGAIGNVGTITSDVDKSDTSYSLGGGMKYGAYSMTLSYEQLGEASASYTGETLDAVSFHQALTNSAPKLVDGISLQGQYTLWQNDAVSASVGLGLFAWELDYTSTLNDSVIAVDEDNVDVFYNVQISYQLTEHVEMSLKASRYNLSVNDVNNMAVGLRYHF